MLRILLIVFYFYFFFYPLVRRVSYKGLSNFLAYHFQKLKFLNNKYYHEYYIYIDTDILMKQYLFHLNDTFYAKYGISICKKRKNSELSKKN